MKEKPIIFNIEKETMVRFILRQSELLEEAKARAVALERAISDNG